METLVLTPENLERSHICCAITEKKGENCVTRKKAWLRERIQEGLVFRRLDARGKVFIEYLPAEYAWNPIDARGYFFINCFWVSGQYKGKGYGKRLLNEAIEDAKAKGARGLAVISAEKKRPFLTDPKFLKAQGFQTCDAAEPYFELLYLPFSPDAPRPQFRACCKEAAIGEKGYVLYYTDQCPFAQKYARIIAAAAEEQDEQMVLRQFASMQDAQSAPCAVTNYALFYDGQFITNEILSETKFQKLLQANKE